MIKKLLPLIILVASILIFLGLTALRSETEKEVIAEKITSVKILKLKAEDLYVMINGTGQVQSDAEITLSPQVAGKVIYRNPNLQKGSRFVKGDLLYRIDPSDYELNYQLAKTDYEKVKIQFDIESHELALLYPQSNDSSQIIPLVARANLKAAETRVKQSKNALDRCYIVAPFNGVCRNKWVDEGQYVAPGVNLAELFSIERSIITVNIEPSELNFIDMSSRTPVTVRSENYHPSKEWSAYVINRGESLDRKTRLSNISIVVDQPYKQTPPLLNGLYTTVTIQGRKLTKVFKIPRYAIHDNNVWINKNNTLEIRKVKVLKYQGSDAIISEQLFDSEELIISNLELPVSGMKLAVSPL